MEDEEERRPIRWRRITYSEMIFTLSPGLTVEVTCIALMSRKRSSFRSVPIMRAARVALVSPERTVTTRMRSGFKAWTSVGDMRRKELRSWLAVASSAVDPLGTAVRNR